MVLFGIPNLCASKGTTSVCTFSNTGCTRRIFLLKKKLWTTLPVNCYWKNPLKLTATIKSKFKYLQFKGGFISVKISFSRILVMVPCGGDFSNGFANGWFGTPGNCNKDTGTVSVFGIPNLRASIKRFSLCTPCHSSYICSFSLELTWNEWRYYQTVPPSSTQEKTLPIQNIFTF